MGTTLDEAIRAVFGTQQPQGQTPSGAALQMQRLAGVRAQFEEAERAMQQGAWDRFGKAMEALKNLLSAPPQPPKQ